MQRDTDARDPEGNSELVSAGKPHVSMGMK